MLSLFPELLFLSPFAAFLIRIAAAIVFGNIAYHHVTRDERAWVKLLGGVEAVVAAMFFVGFLTQLAALVGLVLLGTVLYLGWLSRPATRETAWWLMLVMCISLLVLGAGPFAFDLPL